MLPRCLAQGPRSPGPKWAPSTQNTYIQALRLYRVVALGWDDDRYRASAGASNEEGSCVTAAQGTVHDNAMLFPDPADLKLSHLRPAAVVTFEAVKRFLLACRSTHMNFNTINHLRSAIIMYAKLWMEPPPRVSALAVRVSWIDWAQSR